MRGYRMNQLINNESSMPNSNNPAQAAHGGWLERRFALAARKTSVRTETIAGITSFLAAAYLLVVIPSLLSAGGMDRGAATTATILVFVLSTVLMALYANLPFLVGPGIGGSVILGITLAGEHVAWQTGLGIAFVSGVLFLILTLVGARSLVVRLIPAQIKLGLGASIGLFIAVLGFRNAGMVIANAKTNALALGDFSRPGTLVALIGLGAAVVLQGRRVPGAILWAILIAAAAGVPLGVTHMPASFLSWPHSIAPIAFKLDIASALSVAAIPYLFVFFAAEFFSTLGTTLAVGAKADLLDENANLPNINRPFLVDSIAATLGPVFGIPALTALVESAAGVEAGGRTGLSSLAAAAMFALMLLFVPVALAIPKEATAPALILIGLSMFSTIRHTHFDDFSDSLPVLSMVLLTLMSNSFGTGIAGGLLCYVLVKLLAGRFREVRGASMCWPCRSAITSIPWSSRTETTENHTDMKETLGNVPASRLALRLPTPIAPSSPPCRRSNCIAICLARFATKRSSRSPKRATHRSLARRSTRSIRAAKNRSACCACCARSTNICSRRRTTCIASPMNISPTPPRTRCVIANSSGILPARCAFRRFPMWMRKRPLSPRFATPLATSASARG